MATKKEMYEVERAKGYSDNEIAEIFGVKVETIIRAIGKGTTSEGGEEFFPDDEEEFFTEEEETSANENVQEIPTFVEEEHRVLKTITKSCCDCGEEFTISPAEQKFYQKRDYHLPNRCPECRKKRDVFEEIECIDCGDKFKLRLTEKEFFERNGLHLPMRCESCRESKRKRNESAKAKEPQ